MSLDSWPMERLDAYLGSQNIQATTADALGADTVKSVKAELEFCISHYGDETPTDHLDAILAEVRRELLSFCQEVEAEKE